MARTSTVVEKYVCTNCQVAHAGERVQVSPAKFEAPESCGACGKTEFIWIKNWLNNHE